MRRLLFVLTVLGVVLGVLFLAAPVSLAGGGHGGGGGGHGGGGYHGGGYHGGGYHGGGYYGRGYYGRGYYGGYGYGVWLGLGWPGYGYGGGYGYPDYGYYAYPPDYYGAAPAYPYAPVNQGPVAPPAPGGYTSGYTAGPVGLQQQPNTAVIDVRVPANAQIWFGDAPTHATGTVRAFVTPPLEPGREFSYTIHAHWLENGRAVDRTRTINVAANERRVIDFTASQDATPLPR